MSNKLKEIDIKIVHTTFFDDMISIKTLNPNKIKIDEKSYKNILMNHIGYMTVKDLSYSTIITVNLLYLIISKVNEHIKEGSGTK